MPKVSVIMPAYNAEKYIAEAIDSILSQTFGDFEFIILNDCSKDRTEQIILSYKDQRIVYLKNEQNKGVAATLNKGLGVAKGEYVARMDADDISLPERLEKQVEYLNLHANTAVVGTNLERFGDGMPADLRRFSTNPAQMKVDLLFSCGLAHPSVMMRRAVITELGGYDLAFEGLEDYELWCRVARKYDVTVLPQVLFRYRVHSSQVTKNPSEKFVCRMRQLKKRQLEELGISAEGTVAEVFYNFCNGKKPDTLSEILELGRFFEYAETANGQAKEYDPKLLDKTFRAIMLSFAAALPAKEAGMLCSQSTLITGMNLRIMRMKAVVKRLIGRA